MITKKFLVPNPVETSSSSIKIQNFLSRWEFDESSSSHSSIEIKQSSSSHRGVHLVCRESFSLGRLVFSDTAAAAIPIGVHSSNRVCHACHKRPLSKISVPEGCKFAAYCSRECLSSDSEFLDIYGTSLQILWGNKSDIFDSFYLSTRLYHYCKRDIIIYERILRLVSFSTRPENSFTSRLYELPVFSHKRFGVLEIEMLMQIVKYNSQQFQIFKLPGTYLLAIFPYVSRINHSCAPNVVLMHLNSKEGVICRAVAVREITAGEEITMCYLQDACLPQLARREYLENSFHFTCSCERCLEDIKLPVLSHSPNLPSLSFYQMKDIADTISRIEEVSKLYEIYYVVTNTLSSALDEGELDKLAKKCLCCYIVSQIWAAFSFRYAVFRLQLLLVG